MGFDIYAKVSIGISIHILKLIEEINENNFNDIINIIENNLNIQINDNDIYDKIYHKFIDYFEEYNDSDDDSSNNQIFDKSIEGFKRFINSFDYNDFNIILEDKSIFSSHVGKYVTDIQSTNYLNIASKAKKTKKLKKKLGLIDCTIVTFINIHSN